MEIEELIGLQLASIYIEDDGAGVEMELYDDNGQKKLVSIHCVLDNIDNLDVMVKFGWESFDAGPMDVQIVDVQRFENSIINGYDEFLWTVEYGFVVSGVFGLGVMSIFFRDRNHSSLFPDYIDVVQKLSIR